jgi:myo-inositol-1(or 4)-monophosphatase
MYIFARVNLEKILQDTLAVVHETGEFIARERSTFSDKRVEAKGTNDLVSYVDKESEKRLMDRLQQVFPQAGFIAEESAPDNNRKEWNWIIDPLDGTTNFIHNIPSYAVSVALAHRTEVQAGVVYNIPLQEMFYAQRGGNAYLNGQEIRVAESGRLSDCLVATGFPVKNFDRIEGFQRTTEHFMRHTRGIRRLGAAAVDLAYVACGRFNGFFEYNLNAWDVAAGALIVERAGGKVTDFKGGGDYLFGKEIIACSENVYKEFQQVVSRSFAS